MIPQRKQLSYQRGNLWSHKEDARRNKKNRREKMSCYQHDAAGLPIQA